MGGNGGRRMDFQRNEQRKNYGRVSPWQGGGPGSAGIPNLMPMAGNGVPTEATLALASNILNLLQPRQAPVPSLLDMPIRRDFVPNMGRFDHNFPPQRVSLSANYCFYFVIFNGTYTESPKFSVSQISNVILNKNSRL